MAGNDDPRDLPLDPSEWERTELYREDDPAIADALHEARTQILDEDDAELDVSEITVAPQRPHGLRTAAWIGAALVVGVGALVAVDHYAGRAAEPADAHEAPAPAAARAAPAAARAAPADASPPIAAVAPDASASTPDAIPEDFTAAFRRSERQVQRCLAEHAADAGDAERITLRFDIRVDGGVASARVSPDAIAETELGACLVAVARATTFAPQEQPVGIRIPIALRRR